MYLILIIKNCFYEYNKETEEVKEILSLQKYIKDCIKEVNEGFNGVNIIKDTKIKNKNYFKDGIKLNNTLKNLKNYLKDSTIETEQRLKVERIINYFNDGIQLFEAIGNLKSELDRRANKVTVTNYNERKIKPSFFNLYEDESEISCLKANLILQKAFYIFIAQMTQNFLSILSIDDKKNEENDSKFSININIKENEEINEEEKNKRKEASNAGKIFKKKFMESSKYNSFVTNFCKYHDTIDLYKIPYTFLNEFIYYSKVAHGNNLTEVDVFELIDEFYRKNKSNSLEEIMSKYDKNKYIKEKNPKAKKEKKKESELNNELLKFYDKSEKNYIEEKIDKINIYTFNFINFIEYYKIHLRGLINREQEDDKEIFTKLKTGQFKTYGRNGYYLCNKLLNIYMNITNNNYETFSKLFKLIKCEKNINQNTDNNKRNIIGKDEEVSLLEIIKDKKLNTLEKNLKIFGSYELVDITNVIERDFIMKRCFTSYSLIKFRLLNIIAITRLFESQKISNSKVELKHYQENI